MNLLSEAAICIWMLHTPIFTYSSDSAKIAGQDQSHKAESILVISRTANFGAVSANDPSTIFRTRRSPCYQRAVVCVKRSVEACLRPEEGTRIPLYSRIQHPQHDIARLASVCDAPAAPLATKRDIWRVVVSLRGSSMDI